MLKVYLTNLNAFTSGELRGEWLSLPATQEQIQAAFVRNGIGPDTEYFFSDYECDNFMYECLGVYENIYDLNIIASLLEKEFNPEAVEGFLINSGNLSLQEIGNMLVQADELPYMSYDFEGIENCVDMSVREKYGHTYLEKVGKYAELKKMGLVNYIDYEAIGRDAECSGFILLDNGYYDSSIGEPNMQLYTMKELQDIVMKDQRESVIKKENKKQCLKVSELELSPKF